MSVENSGAAPNAIRLLDAGFIGTIANAVELAFAVGAG